MDIEYLLKLIIVIIICSILLFFNINQTNYELLSNINTLELNNNLLITRDEYLIKLLTEAIFLKYKAPNAFDKLILYIEDFIVIFETLKQNITNIYLKQDQMIQPDKLSKSHQSILLNDLRDALERVMNHLETFIYVIPNEKIYLDSYYNFYQLLRNQLSKYYNRILSMYKINDHTSYYQVIRSSAHKYDFIDNI